LTFSRDHLRRIVAVAHTRGAGFVELVGIAELNPATAFLGANMQGVDLRGEDLSGFDFTDGNLTGALIDGDTDFSLTAGLPTGLIMRDGIECPEMVLIRPGTFMMGTTTEELQREKIPKKYAGREQPQIEVMFHSGFYLGRYPVTVHEFAHFILETGYKTPKGAHTYVQGKGYDKSNSHDWKDPGFPQTDRHPVTCVNYIDATAYAQFLSHKTGKDYRLPSEAEWEYACRAGTKTARFWGDDRDRARKFANVADLSLAREYKREPEPDRFFAFDDGFPFTSPVGSFQPNPFGLYDTLGNVWELVADNWHETYDGAPTDGTVWTAIGSDHDAHVMRGGNWDFSPSGVRSGARQRSDKRRATTGFRLARTL
jgi:formylglycine-generating enzyme required for sulfatase activity